MHGNKITQFKRGEVEQREETTKNKHQTGMLDKENIRRTPPPRKGIKVDVSREGKIGLGKFWSKFGCSSLWKYISVN